MDRDSVRYHGMVIRPPSEADSFIVQVTYGCSHNRCTFCGTYQDKPFQSRPVDDVLADIQTAAPIMPYTRRAFLADGNALVLSTSRLVTILDALSTGFANLQRVGTYANAHDLLNKRLDELRLLCRKGLKIAYLGLESGSDQVLKRIDKGSTAAEMVQAVRHAQEAGIKVSVIGILGIAGPELSAEHAVETGRVVSAMEPRFLSMLTLMLVPGTPLEHQWRAGEFELMEPEDLLGELREVIRHVDCSSGCIFRTNHASNYLPLAGTLPKDKQRLLATLDNALTRGRQALRPEYWRGL